MQEKLDKLKYIIKIPSKMGFIWFMIGHQEIGKSCKSQKFMRPPTCFKTNISILNQDIAHSDPAIINTGISRFKLLSWRHEIKTEQAKTAQIEVTY